jgi:Ca-activated chloride channel family protein
MGRVKKSRLGGGPVLVFAWCLWGASPVCAAASWLDLWLTPPQQAQRLFERGDYAAAAQRFVDPLRAGVAWYRAGEFERAAVVFGQLDTAVGHFNRGNALIMQGKYEAAIEAYDAAVARRPGWRRAEENRELARARLARLAPSDDDAGGTGGQLAADEIVYDASGRVARGGTAVGDEGSSGLTEAQARELWLRRVQTRPADFLRARFARQLVLDAAGPP